MWQIGNYISYVLYFDFSGFAMSLSFKYRIKNKAEQNVNVNINMGGYERLQI